ncbi:MAG TPA: COX15/CtaA family protein [Planctomycetota bacterium]|nr:COX15/CtaA family protein [Planctomycetota bacterium]
MSPLALPSTGARSPALRGPFWLASAIVAWSIVVVLKGAMVTSTGSGLAFSDWPLSDGQVMPERSLTTVPGFLEHFHRLTALLLGTLALALCVWLWRSRAASRAQRRAAFGGGLLILVQGGVGGLGVLLKLSLVTSVAHGVGAQLTVAVFAVLAYMLSRQWQAAANAPVTVASTGGARWLARAAVVLLLLQTLLGAIARHANDTQALWTHVGNALLVFVVLVIAAGTATGRIGHVPLVRVLARTLLLLLLLQLVLGFMALLVRTGKQPQNVDHLWRSALISMHVLVGALLTATAALLWAHIARLRALAVEARA